MKPAAVACVAAALLVPVPVRGDEQTVTCESRNYRYRYCRVDTDNRVVLERQRSRTRCVLWDTWGYDARGVWVDRGCAADFRVGKSGSGAKAAAIAGAVVAGVVVGSVIAANKGKDHDSDPVPSWAVGTYRGYDPDERAEVELSVYPGGAVTGFVRGTTVGGRWEKDRLEVGQRRFRVERSGNGFLAIDDTGRNSRIYFARTGGGY